MSPRRRRLFLPYEVVRLFTGGEPIMNYKGRKDVVAIRWCGKDYKLNIKDYKLVEKICDEIVNDWAVQERNVAEFLSPKVVLKIHDMAAKRIAKNRGDDGNKKKRGILMLKEASGCGYWRMVQPTRYMELPGYFVDISAAQVEFDQCLEYDTIFVQRLFEWEQYYLLEKLKKAGRRVIYDLDDDFFCIPDHNPASRVIGKDQQFACRAIMRIADVITTTTEHLARRIRAELEEDGKEADIRVIPNALDPTEPWLPTEKTGSPDGNLRIFWQGSKSHEEDWNECINAIDTMMGEFSNLRLVILGYLPTCLQQRAGNPLYQGRIEYMPMQKPETYQEIIKHIRADAGIAPLADDMFNNGKSPLKVVENALIGVPTVASDCDPYSSVIEDGENGYLAADQEEWEDCLRRLLSYAEERREMVANARRLVDEQFNINKVAKQWQQALTGK